MRADSRGGQSGSGGGRAPCGGTRQCAGIKHHYTSNVAAGASLLEKHQLLVARCMCISYCILYI